jgi:hypothetical protein
MDKPPANRRICDLTHMQPAAGSLTLQDLDGRIDGRGDLAPRLGWRPRSALARKRGRLSRTVAGAGCWAGGAWQLGSGGGVTSGGNGFVSTCADPFRLRTHLLVALGAHVLRGSALIAVIGGRLCLALLLCLHLLRVAFQYPTLSQCGRARLGGQRTGLGLFGRFATLALLRIHDWGYALAGISP